MTMGILNSCNCARSCMKCGLLRSCLEGLIGAFVLNNCSGVARIALIQLACFLPDFQLSIKEHYLLKKRYQSRSPDNLNYCDWLRGCGESNQPPKTRTVFPGVVVLPTGKCCFITQEEETEFYN